jgi:hypothetical protein
MGGGIHDISKSRGGIVCAENMAVAGGEGIEVWLAGSAWDKEVSLATGVVRAGFGEATLLRCIGRDAA